MWIGGKKNCPWCQYVLKANVSCFVLISHLYVGKVFILQKRGGLAHRKERYLSVTVYSAYASLK